MLKGTNDRFRAFYNRNPPLVILLMLALSQWYYRYVSSNPLLAFLIRQQAADEYAAFRDRCGAGSFG